MVAALQPRSVASLSLVETLEEMAAKSKYLHDILQEAGPEVDFGKVTMLRGSVDDKTAEFQRIHKEINELGQHKDRLENVKMAGELNESRLRDLTAPAARPDHRYPTEPGPGRVKLWTPRELQYALAEHKGIKAFKANGFTGHVQVELPDLDIKTLITLSTASPQADRGPVANMGLEDRTVADLMLEGTISSNTAEYYEETTVTNAAAETAEGSAYPESALAWTLRTENVRDIGNWIPMTRDAVDDNAFLESEVRNRLSFMVRRREETQLLVGDGTAPNISGILDRSGIQTMALGADSRPDAIYKAMQLVRGSAGSGFAEPTAVVAHPADWTDVRLTKTTDGAYLFGGPNEEGMDRIWGKVVRQTTALTQNTLLVGAFRPHAQVLRRTGLIITLSTEHSTYVTERKVLLMAEERIALKIDRPSAFCTITGA